MHQCLAFQPDCFILIGAPFPWVKPWSAKPSWTIFWGQWITLENITISLAAFTDMLDGDKIITAPRISCYGRFINGCKTLCEWAKWMNLTWLCQLHWFCLIAPKTLLPLKALLSIRRLHNPIYSGECVLSRGARRCALKCSRMLTSRCSVLRTVHSRARWRHVNHVRPH